jgi:hypothetical protein
MEYEKIVLAQKNFTLLLWSNLLLSSILYLIYSFSKLFYYLELCHHNTKGLHSNARNLVPPSKAATILQYHPLTNPDFLNRWSRGKEDSRHKHRDFTAKKKYQMKTRYPLLKASKAIEAFSSKTQMSSRGSPMRRNHLKPKKYLKIAHLKNMVKSVVESCDIRFITLNYIFLHFPLVF